jgi:hypothetical protein
MSCVKMKEEYSTDVYMAEVMIMIAPTIESGVGVVRKTMNSSTMENMT